MPCWLCSQGKIGEKGPPPTKGGTSSRGVVEGAD